MSASSEDCPCCDPGGDIDRDMVTAFIAGVSAADSRISIREALCEKHGRLAAACAIFVSNAMASGQRSS